VTPDVHELALATLADLFGKVLGEKSREEFLPGFLHYALDGFLKA